VVRGAAVPPGAVAALRDSADLRGDPAALRRRLAVDGYVYLSAALAADEVLAARDEVARRLEAVGEIAAPATACISTGASRRDELVADRGAFWKSVSEGEALRRVTHGPVLRRLMDDLVGEAARPHDFLFLRAAPVGRATDLHFDYPFFTRAHDRVSTAWIPLGDVPASDGPLTIVEGSNRFADLVDGVRGFDVARDTGRRASFEEDPVALARARGTRLLTADFAAGSIVVFGMYTLHGALDNHSPIGRVRLSCDVRFQPASLPVDERYFGANPGGTTGAGYGELNGAKPLTQPWHRR
jgi:ectoine hydroxylase-related dioxygenase (phytanoyl-CoA dioxygenase family)